MAAVRALLHTLTRALTHAVLPTPQPPMLRPDRTLGVLAPFNPYMLMHTCALAHQGPRMSYVFMLPCTDSHTRVHTSFTHAVVNTHGHIPILVRTYVLLHLNLCSLIVTSSNPSTKLSHALVSTHTYTYLCVLTALHTQTLLHVFLTL